jgi:hypothetical protein
MVKAVDASRTVLESARLARSRDVRLPSAPGGEPLLRVCRRPATFASSLVRRKRVKASGSRKQPKAIHSRLGFAASTPGLIELHHAGSFAGAACFHAFCAVFALRRNSRGDLGHTPKRLPAMGIVKLPESVAAKFSLFNATSVASSWESLGCC